MKYDIKLFANKLLITVAIISIALIVSTSLNGCKKSELFVPEYSQLDQLPKKASIEQIHTDYTTDKIAADLKYKGQRLMSSNVTLEVVFGRYYAKQHGGVVYVEEYFISKDTKFILEDFNLMQNVESSYILNIIGECRGFSNGLLIFSNCWIEGVSSNLGTVTTIDFY